MMMTKLNTVSVAVVVSMIVFFGFGCSNAPKDLSVHIIPQPQELVKKEGYFELGDRINIHYPQGLESVANHLSKRLTSLTNIKVTTSTAKAAIRLIEVEGLEEEGYRLTSNLEGVQLEASGATGFFYGVQSILQLTQQVDGDWFVPVVAIVDKPRFSWRGMHLDVSRHFFEIELIKKYIDYLSAYKINTFHWHLTDDQGWRLEIKKYPKLTSVGAWRRPLGFAGNQTKGLNQDNGEPYGGFYTQEQIREVVQYAKERFITVVPEIEMPGHTSAVLQAYPELACQSAPEAKIWTEAGVSKHLFCAGREETFAFLQNVLTETMDLFPSKYIHVGGDEAPKDHWKNCALCQRRIKAEGLADEHELQSYFIRRIEKFLNDHDRSLVGWDEILEGGLAPNATVMSWRGEAGGIAAAQSGHPAIMTPEHPLYFNHRPIDRENTPGHYSRNNTIRTVYDYDPVPPVLNAEEALFIIGIQANLWVEQIPKWHHVESLLFPRLLALSEIAWTEVQNKNYGDFELKLPTHIERLAKSGAIVGTDYSCVSYSTALVDGMPMMKLSTTLSNLEIRYTTDGQEPSINSPIYGEPLVFDETVTVRAAAFRNGQMLGSSTTKQYIRHQAIGKRVSYQPVYNKRYDAGGKFGLVDGQYGFKELTWKAWQGFQEPKVEIIIDLENETPINEIALGFLSFQRKWIFYPEQVKVEISVDGQSYNSVFSYQFKNQLQRQSHEEVLRPKTDLDVKARFVKLTIDNQLKIPNWHSASGQQPWIFIDEVVIN